MTNQEFLLNLQTLRGQYDMQYLTGAEYNRKLLELHVLHAAALLVEQPGPKPAQDPNKMTATEVYAAQRKQAALALGLSYAHTEWASQHDWYIRRGLDDNGYFVVVRDDGRVGKESTFRDYNALRAWAGY